MFIIAGSVIITFFLWIFSKPTFAVSPLLLVSQISALIGLLLMCTSLIISTRIHLIENLFGGLDKAYKIHHTVGAVAFSLLLAHPLLLVANSYPSAVLMKSYLIPGAYYTYNLGISALYCMIAAFIFIFLIKLPYHWWKQTHRLLGVAGLLGGMHALTIGSDIGSFMPLRLWMGVWIIAGWLSFLYMLIFYRYVGSLFVYVVSHVQKKGSIVTVYATHKRKPLLFKPGQYGYVAFSNKALSREQHPFTFSSAPHERELRISAKALGDYTKKLKNLRHGDYMYIKGPYGTFGKPYQAQKTPLVWVMGGVGVTPFLSMLRDYVQTKKTIPLSLFYCYRTKEDAVFSAEIESLVKKAKNASCYEWCSKVKGRITAEIIHATASKKYPEYTVQLCGPEQMMKNLEKQFIALGIPKSRILYESFSFL